MLPDYLAKAVPNPMGKRAPWYANTAPTYAGIFLWIAFYQQMAGGTLQHGGLALCLAALAATLLHYLKDEAEQKRRIGELEHQPALRQDLHPRADAGRTRAHPHQAEVAILKSLEGPADHGWRLFGKANMPHGMNWIVAVPPGCEWGSAV